LEGCSHDLVVDGAALAQAQLAETWADAGEQLDEVARGLLVYEERAQVERLDVGALVGEQARAVSGELGGDEARLDLGQVDELEPRAVELVREQTREERDELAGRAVRVGEEGARGVAIARVDVPASEARLVRPDQAGVQVPLSADATRRAQVSVAEVREDLAEHHVRVLAPCVSLVCSNKPRACCRYFSFK
jgi:hypothetical protein